VFARAGWVLDLMISLRGFHWRWTDKDMSQYQDAKSILAKLLCKAHPIIHCIKMLMVYDHYFWGQIQAGPPHYLENLLKAQAPLQLYRMLITFLAILSAIVYLCNLPYRGF
jgi:hypothetical protein